MITKQPEQLGSVRVSIESDSLYFSSTTPVEIRDASMQLVARETARVFPLPEGLYRVSAVLEDGQEHAKLVRVGAGSACTVHFSVGEAVASQSVLRRGSETVLSRFAGTGFGTQNFELSLAEGSLAQWRNTRFIHKPDSQYEESASVARIPAKLLHMDGVKLVRQSPGLWIFECVDGDVISAVPTAAIQIGDVQTQISLPAHPSKYDPVHCAVRIDESPRGAHATAWITPERTVANALQNMLAAGNLASAASMADQATELLRDKYADPTGATLAALTLRKVGRLARHESWMENLARDFAWISDAKILLATLLVERRADLDRAQYLALQAAKQRVLYTESYALLLDLLRRWPRDMAYQPISAVIGDLARWSPYVDWNSSCFSVSGVN